MKKSHKKFLHHTKMLLAFSVFVFIILVPFIIPLSTLSLILLSSSLLFILISAFTFCVTWIHVTTVESQKPLNSQAITNEKEKDTVPLTDTMYQKALHFNGHSRNEGPTEYVEIMPIKKTEDEDEENSPVIAALTREFIEITTACQLQETPEEGTGQEDPGPRKNTLSDTTQFYNVNIDKVPADLP